MSLFSVYDVYCPACHYRIDRSRLRYLICPRCGSPKVENNERDGLVIVSSNNKPDPVTTVKEYKP